MSRFPNRRWLVIPTTITGSINFDEVLEYSKDTLRVSLDGKNTFVKYELTIIPENITTSTLDPETGEETFITTPAGTYGRPSFYTSSYSEYDHESILSLLATDAWTDSTELE
tara:strand:- start:889 stop:1224 length:336 start_codon:yes stop_codon:yes gene_type:complete